MVLSAESRSFLAIIVLCACFLCDPAFAACNFSLGMEYFSNGSYADAANIFEECVNETADDKEAYYFAAKSFEKIGKLSKARVFYAEIAKKFPDSSYASDALVQIGKLDSAQYSTSDISNLPIQMPDDEIVVDYELSGNHINLPVEINGKPWRMIFDTGGNQCMFGKNHLRQLGIAEPNWETAHYVINVMGKNPVWQLPVNLDIGGCKFPNFRVYVTKNMPTKYPSLGQRFISKFNFLIDAKGKKIHFVKRGSDRSFAEQLAKSAYKQPFHFSPDDRMIIDAHVNGIPCAMDLDVGATLSVFTRQQLAQLGIPIASTAVSGMTNTMVGKAPMMKMTIENIQFGPVKRYDAMVQVHEGPSLKRPLLGLDFFKDLSFFVDFDRSEILFFSSNGT